MENIKSPLRRKAAVLAAGAAIVALAGGGAVAAAADNSTVGHGRLYVICQKVGTAEGWQIVVSQNNVSNNVNRFLIAVTDGIDPQDARAVYDARQCLPISR